MDAPRSFRPFSARSAAGVAVTHAPLHDAPHAPALARGQRPGFDDLDRVADLRVVGLVVRHERAPSADVPLVHLVTHDAVDPHDDGLVRLVRHDDADLRSHAA
jgi:hypothetical protein